MHPRSVIAAVIVAALLASPAAAQGSVSIPEPSDAALFALGVIGLIVGRRGARRPRR